MKEEVMGMLTRMEQAVATAAPAVWGAAIKQARLDGMASVAWALLWGFLFLALALVAGLLTRRGIKERDNDYLAVAILPGVFAVFFMVACTSQIVSAYERFTNPEWRALQLLAEMLQ